MLRSTSALSRKPLSRQAMHLGHIISKMCALGAISVHFYERKHRLMPLQIICQIRIRLPIDTFTSDLDYIYKYMLTTVPLLSYVVYKEKDFWYADYKFLAI